MLENIFLESMGEPGSVALADSINHQEIFEWKMHRISSDNGPSKLQSLTFRTFTAESQLLTRKSCFHLAAQETYLRF